MTAASIRAGSLRSNARAVDTKRIRDRFDFIEIPPSQDGARAATTRRLRDQLAGVAGCPVDQDRSVQKARLLDRTGDDGRHRFVLSSQDPSSHPGTSLCRCRPIVHETCQEGRKRAAVFPLRVGHPAFGRPRPPEAALSSNGNLIATDSCLAGKSKLVGHGTGAVPQMLVFENFHNIVVKTDPGHLEFHRSLNFTPGSWRSLWRRL